MKEGETDEFKEKYKEGSGTPECESIPQNVEASCLYWYLETLI